MTDRTVTEIEDDIIVFLDDPHTMQEVLDEMPEDEDIVRRIMLLMASQGRIMIAPGTNAKKWTTSVRAKCTLKAMGGDEDE